MTPIAVWRVRQWLRKKCEERLWRKMRKRFAQGTKVRLFMSAVDREDIDKFLQLVHRADKWCEANIGPEFDQWCSQELNYWFLHKDQALMFKLICG